MILDSWKISKVINNNFWPIIENAFNIQNISYQTIQIYTNYYFSSKKELKKRWNKTHIHEKNTQIVANLIKFVESIKIILDSWKISKIINNNIGNH